MNLEKLFNPQSIAIVGASPEEGTVGNVLAKNLLQLGYVGKIFLVNPKHDEILGQKCYKRLTEVEQEVDLAVVAIPAKLVAEEIRANATKIKNYVIISAGFSEIGDEGRKREEELNQLAVDNDLNILGPNCLGFIIPRLKLNVSFAGGLPEEGNIAFISQSGALAVAMMDVAKKENIKFSSVVSIGNKMQLTETEILEYFSNDSGTKVIGMYLEGIKNGKKFMEVAKKTADQKPVVIIKAGKTERSQKAISSHTGALAGSEEITSAVFEKTGVIKASDLEEFFDLVDLVSNTSAPKTNQVAVVTNAGGPGVLTTDAFGGKSIELATIDEKIKTKLKKILPAEASVENPIDLLGDAGEDRYAKTLKILDSDPNIGTIICLLTPQDQTPVDKIARKIINFKNKTEKTIVTVFIGGDRVKKAIKKMENNGIPNYSFPDRAVKVLDDYYCWKIHRDREPSELLRTENKERRLGVENIIKKAKADKRQALYFSEARKLINMYGINSVICQEVGTSEESLAEGVSFPVVLKVDSDKVLHKTDKKGLILNITNQEKLVLAITEIKNNFPGEKIIIQPMVERQTELIIGLKKDDIFGPVIIFGLGGIYTEVFKMVDFLIPPLLEKEIRGKIIQSKLGFLFRETRGQSAYNLDELVSILVGFSQLSQENEEIREIDLNPLLVYNDGRPAQAVDVKILI